MAKVALPLSAESFELTLPENNLLNCGKDFTFFTMCTMTMTLNVTKAMATEVYTTAF